MSEAGIVVAAVARPLGRLRSPLAPAIGWLALLLALSILARVEIYTRVPTRLGPDGYSYLNLARQLRGVPTPSGWDGLANMARDDQAARTPGYPLLLNLTFLLAGHRPTPTPLLAAFDRQRRFDAWHFNFLARSENIRAVHLVQHALGISATVLAYMTVLRWTRRPWLAALAAGLAVGLRPTWFYFYEPVIQTEVVAGTLMLLLVWMTAELEGRPAIGLGRAALIAAASAAGVLVRPALIFGTLLVVAGIRTTGRCRGRALTAAAALWLAVIGAWVVRNGVNYGYWGLSSVVPATLASHLQYDRDAFTDPMVGTLCAKECGQPHAGVWILRSMVLDGGLSYLEASSRLGRQSIRVILRHPGAYLASVASGFVRFWYPQEILFPWEGVRTRGIDWIPPSFWTAYVVLSVLATAVAGFLIFSVRVPRMAKLATAMVAVSAVGVSLIVGVPLDNVRAAFPFAPILLMASASVVGRVLDRLDGLPRDPSDGEMGQNQHPGPSRKTKPHTTSM